LLLWIRDAISTGMHGRDGDRLGLWEPYKAS
jgi:hypothetical protein